MHAPPNTLMIQARLKVPGTKPHEELANLRDDAAASFAARWEFFDAEALGLLGDSVKAVLLNYRNELRRAWRGDQFAIESIKLQAQGTAHLAFTEEGQLEIIPDNLWSLICILFLRDHAAGRTAICANPDCHSRFFIKTRKTQRFCSDGPCVIFARRSNAQSYWDTKGKARREQRRAAKRANLKKRRRAR